MWQPDLNAQRVGPLLFKLSFPAIAGMILYSMFSLVDTYFVARLGSQALAALTLSVPLQILISSLASASGTGLTSLISRTLGAGDGRMADNIAWHGLIIAVIYGVCFSLVGFYFLDPMLLLFGCTPDTFFLCREYLQIVLAGSVFTFLLIIMENIMQGEGDTVMPMLVGLGGIILNVIFDPVFMFGLGPLPGMGMRGAAWATVLSELLSTWLIFQIITRRRLLLAWKWAHFRPSLRVVKGVYAVGLPMLMAELAWVFSMTVQNRLVAGYGYTAVAAIGIFLRVRSFCLTPVFGLAQAALPMAAFAHGAGSAERVKETLVKSGVLGIFLLLAAVFFMQCHPDWIVGLFSKDPGLTETGISGLRLATLCFPLLSPIFMVSTVLQALGKGVKAMMMSMIRQLVLFLPLLLLLSRIWGLNGVWMAFSISEFLAGGLALVFAIDLWRELPGRRRVARVVLLQPGYWLRRTLAWIK
ncbi:MAG TPA: MATE family efflux transporter [Syntrophomonadaceae bacterium]|nr:MATE family efflux transporter [Syntrophomonadaceae bacterium]